MASRLLVCKAANAASKIILLRCPPRRFPPAPPRWNLKVALVLSVICIGVKGFFFCLLFLFLLHKGVDVAVSSQSDQSQYA